MPSAPSTLGQMPIRYFRQAYFFFGNNKHRRAAILADTGVTPSMLEDGEMLIEVAAQIQQMRNLIALIGEDYPLKAKTVWRPASQGALDIAFRTAPDIGEGLHYLARYAWVRAPQICVEIKPGAKALAGSAVTLYLRPSLDLALADWRPMAEIVMLSLQAMLEGMVEAMGTRINTDNICYTWPWPPPAHANGLDQAFYGRNQFHAKNCSVSIPAEIAALTSPYADKALLGAAIAQLEGAQEGAHGPVSLTAQVKGLIETHDPHTLNAQSAANALSMSVRTMVRQLHDEETSFRQLRDDHRQARAHQMITQSDLTRDAIAQALGYQDPASLSRSCHRWFGKPLRALRCQHR